MDKISSKCLLLYSYLCFHGECLSYEEEEYGECNHLISLDEGKGRFTFMYLCSSNSVNQDDFRDSGVKKSFVLACAENVPERYQNV